MAVLSACPICRSNLERFAADGDAKLASCPDCGSDLSTYNEIKLNAQSYVSLAADLISRGDTGRSALIIDSVARLVSDDELPLASVRARLAIAQHRLTDAKTLLDSLEPPERDTLAAQLQELESRLGLAREQYNAALASARKDQYAVAQTHILRATQLAPADPEAWKLKLKIDLKARDYAACYEDLQQLDGLGQRPYEYSFLESILPPV